METDTKPHLNILYLEDTPDDVELVKATLKAEGIFCNLVQVDDRDRFVNHLIKGDYDLILADYRLPSFDGIAALSIAHDLLPAIPFIFISGTIGEELAIEVMKKGATDYVLKHRLSRLGPAVTRAIREYEESNKRKKAEDELRKSEQKYRQLVENIDEVIYKVEYNGDPLRGLVNFVSTRVVNILGYSPEEFLKYSDLWFNNIHSDDKELVLKATEEIVHSKKSGIRVYRFRHKQTGEYLWIEDKVVPLVNGNGKVIGFYGVARDVTERKQNEEVLRKLSNAIQHTADNIFITDKNGIIEYVNPSFEKITGYRKEEVIGKTPSILKSDQHDINFFKKLWETILGGDDFRAVFINRRKDGQIFYEEKTISPIKDDGNITHFVSTGRDITEHKLMEDQIKMMEKLSALGQLSASIAHEIRNPLAAIQLNIQMLAEKLKIPKTLKETFQDIQLGLQKIGDIITGILQFARPRTPDLKSEDLHKVLDVSIRSLEKEFKKNEIRIFKEWGIGVPKIMIDQTQMVEVFENLFRNARDAMQKGGEITVRTIHQRNFVEVQIEDTGQGIPPENLDKIFTPFFTTKTKGTGLGLSIIFRILEQQKAQIGVESKVGIGTKFKLLFPISKE